MRLDRVEIKVNSSGDQTESAVAELGLPPVDEPWRIHFCEDVARGVSAGTPLRTAGVVLRARHKPDSTDDSTIKLRPGRRSQLTDDWLAAEKGDDGEVKIEADWAGQRRVLAISHTADRPDDIVAGAGRGQRSAASLFTKAQETFLRDCSPIRVNLRTLTVLPPITATRWDDLGGTLGDLDVRAERWTVDHLDFLELSTVAKLDEAESKQSALNGYLDDFGVPVDSDPRSKTDRVLEHLVKRTLATD
ncbi:hypothetical protein [Modestobacter excelsi]|uniref:hypothetical protein n=1 Tax=Modestobacter excelsi TaxID=2213161 RepID=UPI00110CA203|nr:hypothetical protein [Modestobacter excelsi]